MILGKAMINLRMLAEKLDRDNLMQKSFFDLSMDEINTLVRHVYESTGTDCCYHYICVQVPSYIAKCTSPDKCKRLLYFAQNKIPKLEAKGD